VVADPDEAVREAIKAAVDRYGATQVADKAQTAPASPASTQSSSVWEH
jgi:hypothetical protein